VAELFRVFTGDTSIIVFFILIFLVSVSENLYFLVFPVLVSNSSDYANYKTGKKASGGNIIGAGYMVATIASGLGAAGLGYILQWAGYVKGMKEATPQLLTGINILFIWIPLACWLLIGVIFQSWKKQNAELDEFRKNDPNYVTAIDN
jgi:GPH family glycoside/pentoside/hexuronide:cation symporter